jgi:type IV pilus assembly protein PilA
MKHSAAFTLIELLTVVAILSFLLLAAIPAYKDYSVRVKVSEAMGLAGPVTLAVTETYHAKGTFPTSNNEAGIDDLQATLYVDKIDVMENGKVLITLNKNELGISTADDTTIVFTPKVGVGRVTWDCVGGSLEQKYRPSACRI